MLSVQNISLLQFKNYENSRFVFTENIVAICGKNGKGKTNLLDAIYLACFSKSYFSKSDSANVYKGLSGMRVEANFLKEGEPEKIVCILRENNKKELQRNGGEYKRFSHHIGLLPAVMIAPDDLELITGSSETRRKFIDTLLSQSDKHYLEHLIAYNKILLQRNSFLKAASERGFVDEELLQIFNRQILTPANYLFKKRTKFLTEFLPLVVEGYHNISGINEPVALAYYSPLQQDSYDKLLQAFQPKDLMLQRTTTGIHKDDLDITLNGEPFKNMASQGQRKSLLFALKLAEFDYLAAVKGFAPLLFLDDVFEKLDSERIKNLLQQVCKQNDGQVFITDTHKDRLEAAFSTLDIPYQLIELE